MHFAPKTPAGAQRTALPCIGLAGPTAAGKTAAALAIARQFPDLRVEIISVDSALVYQGMDVGTAKPTAFELASVPHHLIDIRAPHQPYSAAEFVQDATTLIAQIQARGGLPLLVGGTMLYFKALFDGLDDMPPADASVRAALAIRASAEGWPALHAELARLDPSTAVRLAPNDSQRISRALEVMAVSGKPLSWFHGQNATKNVATNRGAACSEALISLEPLERSWLHERIAQRFDAMLSAGLISEVTALRARAELTADLPSMRCVGYRQVWEALDAQAAAGQSGALTTSQFNTMRDKGIFASRQLAKRQLTWLRSMPARRQVACDAHRAMQQVVAQVQSLLDRHAGLANQSRYGVVTRSDA